MRRVPFLAPAVFLLVTTATAQVPSPMLEGPITSPGAAFIQATAFDLGEFGYQQEEYFFSGSALSALNRRVRTGKAPTSAPRLEIDPGPPVAIVTDEHGNAVGGIRTPQVDAPIAAFTGLQPGSILCMLFGTTDLFDDAKLATLYPKKKSFRKAFTKALKRSVRARWITKPDAKLMKKWAKSADVGG